MCRAEVHPAAVAQLARLLTDVARILAEQEGADPADVRIGPVDFGAEPEVSP